MPDADTTRSAKTAWVAGALGALGLAAALGWSAWDAARSGSLRREADRAIADGEPGRAEAALERYAWYRPEDLESLMLRTRLAVERGDRAGAAALLATVPPHSNAASGAALARARLLLELFRLREAERDFRLALRIDREQLDARRALVALLGIQRRADEQVAELWRLNDANPAGSLEALRLLAQGAVVIPPDTLSRTADEGQILRGCLEADPDDPHVRPALAYFLRHRGEASEAIALLESWIPEHPRDAPALVELAACHLDDGRPEDAESLVAGALEAAPRSADAHGLRADLATAQGRRDEAVAAAREAVRLDPRDPARRYKLGQALRAVGSDEEASQSLELARMGHELRALVGTIPAVPTDPGPLVEAGRICSRLDRTREARGWLRLALRIAPGRPDAREALASLPTADVAPDPIHP